MTDFRGQSNMSGHEVRPLIQIVCNFTKPVGEKPSLLSFDEVETFMHEFGHAMHGMLSDVHYPSVSGTSVRHDFVEMPSQVMENWCYETSFLNTFARHYQSGEPIPEDSIDHIWEKFYKVDKARTREYGGSGVGLSIVKAIMDSMHQEYGVRNYDNGVEFWFELETR